MSAERAGETPYEFPVWFAGSAVSACGAYDAARSYQVNSLPITILVAEIVQLYEQHGANWHEHFHSGVAYVTDPSALLLILIEQSRSLGAQLATAVLETESRDRESEPPAEAVVDAPTQPIADPGIAGLARFLRALMLHLSMESEPRFAVNTAYCKLVADGVRAFATWSGGELLATPPITPPSTPQAGAE